MEIFKCKMVTNFTLWYYVVMLNLYHVVSELIIVTTTGPVRGKVDYFNHFEYRSFQAIPYAENPSGVLRFQPPVPKKPWSSVLDATQNGVVCPQRNWRYSYEQMSEDCLNLNVYVPKNFDGQLPVLVFVHGGGYSMLAGNSDYIYGPQFFLQHGVIVVTMNFRIGPLGFLSLNINEASGNAGLKDLILALKWIKLNISKFGGNGSNITLGGHSSGAALVHCLMMTNQTKDLFHRAILISGSALNQRLFSQRPTKVALALANELGIKTDDKRVILQRLQQSNVFTILNAFSNLTKMDTSILKSCSLFAPSVERKFSHAVLTESPIKIIEKGLMQTVPILAGINAEEGTNMIPEILKNEENLNNIRHNFELCVPTHFEYPTGSREAKMLGNSIAQKYLHIRNSTKKNIMDQIIELISDIRYNYDVFAWIKLYKHNPLSSALYFYVFNFDGDLNWTKLNYNIEHPGTSHADELGYIFVTNRTVNRIKYANKESKYMINITVTLLSNFIKFGTPLYNKINWPEFELTHRKYLMITTKPTVQVLLNSRNNFDFWEKIHDQYQKYIRDGGIVEDKCIKLKTQ